MGKIERGIISRFHPLFLEIPWMGAVLFALDISITGLKSYWAAFENIKPVTAGLWGFLVTTMALGCLFVWCGLWSLAGRVFSRRAFFMVHWNVALSASLMWTLISAVFTLIGFAFNADDATNLPTLVAFWGVGLWTLHGHLRLASPAPARKLFLTALIIMTVLSAGTAGFGYLLLKKMPAIKTMETTVLPPAFLLVPPRSPEETLASLETLKTKADKRAKEK